MPIIGIDLGTSNSAAAVLRGRRPVIIPSAEGITLGGKAFPSYVALTANGLKDVKSFRANVTKAIERGLRADVSLVKAWKADLQGNLVYRKTARNFNPVMATAGMLFLKAASRRSGTFRQPSRTLYSVWL